MTTLRRAREGSGRHGAFLASFVAQSVVGIGFVAAFASTPFGLGLLYDRYLFYLVPLWLVVFALWIQEGMPKPIRPLAAGAALAVASIAALPFAVVARDDWFSQFEAVATEAWGKVGQVSARLPVDSPRALAILFALALALGTALVPRRRAPLLVAAVVLVMGANLALAWRSAFVDAADFGVSPRGTRAWVDDRLGAHRSVTLLYVARACRPHAERTSGYLTDFFNRSVSATVSIGGEGAGAPDSLRLLADGTLVRHSGARFAPRYLVTQPGIRLDGTVLASGMATRLVLWEIHGPARITNVRNEEELARTRCAA
jgi:hypothetical protein